MSIVDFAVKFFQDSGVAIYFSIAIMAVGLSIAIERYIFLQRARSENRKLWAKVLPMLQNGRLKEVHNVASGSDAAIGPCSNRRAPPSSPSPWRRAWRGAPCRSVRAGRTSGARTTTRCVARRMPRSRPCRTTTAPARSTCSPRTSRSARLLQVGACPPK